MKMLSAFTLLLLVASWPMAAAAQEPGGELLLLNRFQFDPVVGEPDIPPEQRTTLAPGEEGFHLVQLVGPTQDEWLDRLRGLGVVVIQFQPIHAYIVRMTPEEAAVVRQESFVRAVNVYHAAYRIAPSVLNAETVPPGPGIAAQRHARRAMRRARRALRRVMHRAKRRGVLARPAITDGIIANVDVTIYDDGETGGSFDRTIRAIEAAGGDLVATEKARADDLLATATFALASPAVVPVAQLNGTLWLNFRPPVDGLDDEISDQIVAGNVNPIGTGYQAWLTAMGLTGGMGVTVAVVDSGYDTGNNTTAHNDLLGRLVPVGTPTDTNGHGTHVGGIIAGNAALGTLDASGFLLGLGVAPAATLVVRANTAADAAQARDAVINGAVASNHSYSLQGGATGYSNRDRTYDFLVRDADQMTAMVAEPLIIVFSAGNCGLAGSLPANCLGTVGVTKEAKNVIAVANAGNQRTAAGAPVAGVGNIGTITASSSPGSASDGRLYPHVAAPGTNIVSTRSSLGSASCLAIATGAPAMSPTYSMCTGTSMAAPHVTGAVALTIEWWRSFNAGANPSPAMAKALLTLGAVDMGTADIPNNNEGWGRVDLTNVIGGLPAIYMDQSTTFAATGNTASLQVSRADITQPLRVALAWSDAPGAGSGGMTAAWVNDLDLMVTEAASTNSFLGNVYTNGVSTPGGVADVRDNLETVFVQTPVGPYDITVVASNIAGDGVPYNGDPTDQDFALVCSNCVPNQAPVCDANGPYKAECAGPTTTVTLDGTDSSDPNGDPLTFTWTGPFVGGTATGPTPMVQFAGSGMSSVTLEVDDGLLTSQCSTTVTIEDTAPPAVSCSVARSGLWPPNHNLVDVGLTSTATDVCSGPLQPSVTVFANEEDEEQTGDGHHAPDAVAAGGLRLRSERKGNGDGRVYLILASAVDGAGNIGHDCCTVTVPHSASGAAVASVAAQAAAAEAFCAANGAPPAGFSMVGDGPVVGPKQ